jgi:hypothetical protein
MMLLPLLKKLRDSREGGASSLKYTMTNGSNKDNDNTNSGINDNNYDDNNGNNTNHDNDIGSRDSREGGASSLKYTMTNGSKGTFVFV